MMIEKEAWGLISQNIGAIVAGSGVLARRCEVNVTTEKRKGVSIYRLRPDLRM